MSHGRSHPRHPRAPFKALSDSARLRRPYRPETNPYRIGPPAGGTGVDWHERGIAHEIAGDYAAAAVAYRQALRVGGPTPQVVFDLAHALAELGETAAAIERYWQVIELDGNRADAWLNVGELLLQIGEAAAGIETIRHAVRLDPADADGHFNLADALAADDPNAAFHWRAFLALNAGSAEHRRYAKARLVPSPGTPGEG